MDGFSYPTNVLFDYIVNKIMDLSMLTNLDIFLIKASFETMFKTRCNELVSKFMKRGYTKAVAIQHVEKQNGCGKIHKTPQYEIDDYVLYTCPCKYADYGLINNLLNLAEAFNKGILPESGGYLDQNGKNLDAIFLVNSLLDNYKYEQELEQQKKLKHRK